MRSTIESVDRRGSTGAGIGVDRELRRDADNPFVLSKPQRGTSAAVSKDGGRASSFDNAVPFGRCAPSSLPKESKVVVSGVNVATRHKKPTQLNPQGGLERKEAPMHISKVAIADPKDGKATRVRFELAGDKKVRVAARSGEKIDG